jgi:hypothetical protein
VPFPPELVVARFPYDAPLLGAVALAVEAALASSPDDGAGPPETTGPPENTLRRVMQ